MLHRQKFQIFLTVPDYKIITNKTPTNKTSLFSEKKIQEKLRQNNTRHNFRRNLLTSKERTYIQNCLNN